MRIAFAEFLHWDYDVDSVDEIPLGGSQSAACHLARALARAGHEVTFISNTSRPGIHAGVRCLWWDQTSTLQIHSWNLDAMICILSPGRAVKVRTLLGPRPRLILWNHHSHTEDAISGLEEEYERDAYDGFAMVSEWQREGYQQRFGIESSRIAVLRNVMSPAFANFYPPGESILAQKAWPPLLAYTSTPYRGLDLLLDAFPSIREAVPGTRLQVYSSMKVYQSDAGLEQTEHGPRYDRCREMEGVDYYGSVPQPELARRLREVTALAYPNIYPETSCISVMEAMAAGCHIITSRLGALPETTAGYARLIPVDQTADSYRRQFIAATIEALRSCTDQRQATEQHLRAQVDYINHAATWDLRAAEWAAWLSTLPSYRPARQAMTLRQAFDLAMQYRAAGRRTAAESVLWSIIEVQRHHAEALHQLGLLALEESDFETAERLVTRAISFQPLTAHFRLSLGDVLAAQGRPSEAISAWQAALQLQPNLIAARERLEKVLGARST